MLLLLLLLRIWLLKLWLLLLLLTRRRLRGDWSDDGAVSGALGISFRPETEASAVAPDAIGDDDRLELIAMDGCCC